MQKKNQLYFAIPYLLLEKFNSDAQKAFKFALSNDLLPHPAIVRALIAAGADVDEQNSRGCTALMWAAQKNHPKAVEALIAAGANVNEQNNSGCTALMWAAQKNSPEVVEALIAAGANVNQKDTHGRTALYIAMSKDHTKIIQILAKRK